MHIYHLLIKPNKGYITNYELPIRTSGLGVNTIQRKIVSWGMFIMSWCRGLTYVIYKNYSLSLSFLSFIVQNATEITTKLLRTLKKDNVDGEDINVLLATQELEKFAISYGKIHNKANESRVLSDKLFGKS